MAESTKSLYHEDYHAWAVDQAAALRRLAESRWNGPLDLEHLAEEVEALGKTERNTVLSQIERIIEHALKLEHAASREPRRGWILFILEARRELRRYLSPTLRRLVEEQLAALYAGERSHTARALGLHDEPEAASALPAECLHARPTAGRRLVPRQPARANGADLTAQAARRPGRLDRRPSSASNNAESWPSITPPSCSGSEIVTARR
jgi:hypothetical protein